MKTWFFLGAFILLGNLLCAAESWSGTLVDSACLDQQPGSPQMERHSPPSERQSICVPTTATTKFGVQTEDGHLLRFDRTGNVKAAELLRGATASATGSNSLIVTVTGTQNGRELRVGIIQALE